MLCMNAILLSNSSEVQCICLFHSRAAFLQRLSDYCEGKILLETLGIRKKLGLISIAGPPKGSWNLEERQAFLGTKVPVRCKRSPMYIKVLWNDILHELHVSGPP